MFCSKTLPGWAGLFRVRLGHMLGALDLTRPIVRGDKAMQGETMVHIGEEGGEQLRGCTMRSFPSVSAEAPEGQKNSPRQCPGCTTVCASFLTKHICETKSTSTLTCFKLKKREGHHKHRKSIIFDSIERKVEKGLKRKVGL